jgi:nuclear polyadenylated RNA-binding protein NAB2
MTGAMHANSPLAQALSSKIMPKLEEIGWAVGGDDSVPLSEYICLMLVNGKSQTQIAEELSGEHLGIADMDSAQNFAGWLFEQVEQLSKTHGATEASGITAPAEEHQEQHQQHDEQQHHFDGMEGAHDEQTYDSTGDAEMGEHEDEQGDSSMLVFPPILFIVVANSPRNFPANGFA